MSCILNIKKENRYCQYCSAICDERQPKPIETFTTNRIDMTDKNKIKYNLRRIIKGKPSPAIKKVVNSLTPEIMDEAKKELEQEPVSNNLEDAAEDYCKSTLVGSHYIKKNAFKAGAKWQKQQDQSTIELVKEPVSEDLNTESMIESYKQRLISKANGMKNNPLIDMCLASYKHGINETLDTLNLSNLVRIGKNWKEPKFKVGDRIKFKGIHNEDVTRVITDIKEGEGVGFRYFFADGSIYSIGDDGIELVEEPISEELEEAANNALNNVLNTHEIVNVRSCLEMFKFGVQWQKEQDKDTIELAEDHAMLAGMEKMKEEMMAKAKSGTVQKDNQVILDNGTYIDLDPSMQLKPSFVGLKEGDRIKVIVIKEE